MDVIRKMFIGLTLLFASMVAVAAAEPLDVNTADAVTMAKVMQGVGPAKAALIVQYREKNGPFTNLYQLTKVRGIGKRTVDMNEGKIIIGK